MWDANLNSVVHPRVQGWAASIRLILFKIMAVKQFYFIVKSEKYMILFVYPIFSLHKTQFALVWTIHEIPDGASISNKSDAAGKPQITLGARVWIMTGTIATLRSRSLHSTPASTESTDCHQLFIWSPTDMKTNNSKQQQPVPRLCSRYRMFCSHCIYAFIYSKVTEPPHHHQKPLICICPKCAKGFIVWKLSFNERK